MGMRVCDQCKRLFKVALDDNSESPAVATIIAHNSEHEDIQYMVTVSARSKTRNTILELCSKCVTELLSGLVMDQESLADQGNPCANGEEKP